MFRLVSTTNKKNTYLGIFALTIDNGGQEEINAEELILNSSYVTRYVISPWSVVTRKYSLIEKKQNR